MSYTVTSFEPVFIAGWWFFASHCQESQSIVIVAKKGTFVYTKYFTRDVEANEWIEGVVKSHLNQ